MLKYSRQRECIKEFLSGRKDHPTADDVYMHVRQQFPSISLGTVYRNLALLSDIGEIIRISVGDGVDRFDYCTEPHYHVICEGCGCVQDIEMPKEDMDNFMNAVSKYYDGVLATPYIYFKGTCSECMNLKAKVNN